MPEALISTHTVCATSDGGAVEMTAKLDGGVVVAGMFVHIPLNRSLDLTVQVEKVVPTSDGRIKLLLDCDKDSESADFIAFAQFCERDDSGVGNGGSVRSRRPSSSTLLAELVEHFFAEHAYGMVEYRW